MSRVTVMSGGRLVAEGETHVGNPGDALDVESAARTICKAKRKSLPRPATVRVYEATGILGGWKKVAERVVGG